MGYHRMIVAEDNALGVGLCSNRRVGPVDDDRALQVRQRKECPLALGVFHVQLGKKILFQSQWRGQAKVGPKLKALHASLAASLTAATSHLQIALEKHGQGPHGVGRWWRYRM